MHDHNNREATTDELAELEAGLSDNSIMVVRTPTENVVAFCDPDAGGSDNYMTADLDDFVPVEP